MTSTLAPARGALVAGLLGAAALAPLVAASTDSTAPPGGKGVATVGADRLMAHIRTLASDEYDGRYPGTAGEDRTVAYLIAQFKQYGLVSGNPDGSWVQEVPMVGIDGKPDLQFSAGGKALPMTAGTDYVAVTPRFVPEVTVKDSPLVFVGYGVQAPEYGWDDYKGLDVHGKTLVMLINDPAIPDPKDPSKLDPSMFKGSAMTYYGRWVYKYEIATKLGAAGAIIVHETIPAAYPWQVVQSSWSEEQSDLANPDRNLSKVAVEGWITLDQAHALFKAAGQDFDALHAAALKKDFRPVPLDARMSAKIVNQVRELKTRNVLAALPGSDPALKNEWFVINAHWDHLGHDNEAKGDGIYNGARDNASGTAGLLEMARVMSAGPRPKRSILFLAAAAEEQGILGSQFYCEHPLVPIKKTVGMLNMDSLNVWGPTRDLQVIGYGQTTLEDDLARVLAKTGRVAVPDREPEKGYYLRSDQFNFAKVGIPGLYADDGREIVGKPGYGEQKHAEYVAKDYHQPSDEVKADWDLAGAAQDVQALTDVADDVANRTDPPRWKDGSEFKTLR